MVIASDGVWEFLSNDEIARIVKPFFEVKNAEKAAEAVVKESYLRWKREEEGIVDDITCVIVFLDVKLVQQDPSPNLMGTATATGNGNSSNNGGKTEDGGNTEQTPGWTGPAEGEGEKEKNTPSQKSSEKKSSKVHAL